jgi:cyanate permease
VLLGVYFAGTGAGIVASGAAVPALLAAGGQESWRLGWLTLGAMALPASAGAALAARRAEVPPPASPDDSGWQRRTLATLIIAYGLFGAGYIAYMTFIVAFLRQHGVGTTAISVFWIVLGLAAVASAFAWGGVLGRLRGGRGPAAVMTAVLAGAALPLLSGES